MVGGQPATYGVHERQAFRLRWDYPEPEAEPIDVDTAAERWVEEVRRYGLTRVVFQTGGGNQALAGAIKSRADIFSGFAHHDPCHPGAAGELQRAVERLGLSGYKIIAPQLSCSLQNPALEPIWSYLESKQLPVLIHFGLLGGIGGIPDHPMINPLVIYPVARRHPEIPFIIPHFGSGYWRELLHLCWSCSNIHVDTSGSNDWRLWMPCPLSLKDLFRKAYETIGSKRIIFGSDSSWFPRGFAYRVLQDQVRACLEVGLKETDLRDVFGGNAARLLGVPLNGQDTFSSGDGI